MGLLAHLAALFTVEMVLSAFLGAIISLPITLFFAWRSSKQLREESAELRRLNSILIFGVQNQGKFEIEVDEEGRIVSVNRIGLDGTLPAMTGGVNLSNSEPDKN